MNTSLSLDFEHVRAVHQTLDELLDASVACLELEDPHSIVVDLLAEQTKVLVTQHAWLYRALHDYYATFFLPQDDWCSWVSSAHSLG